MVKSYEKQDVSRFIKRLITNRTQITSYYRRIHSPPLQNMRILQITPYYLPHTGGIERYVYNLAQHLTKNGHTVDIATANVPESSVKETQNNTTIFRYPLLCSLLGNPIVTNLSDLRSRLEEYDIIHIHGVYTYIALRTVLSLGKKHRQKVILTHHGRVVYTNRLKNLFVKIYEQVFVRFILKRLDHAVVLSKSDKEQFVSLGMNADSISIIPNGIDISVFSKPNDNELASFRQKYQLQGKSVVLFLAVISERKGIFDLLQAFRNVEEDNTCLLVVGDGPDKLRAVSLVDSLGISERARFVGRLPFSEILCAYSVANLYVLPSYFEGMPTTVMEALVMGCPVLASDIPGVGDNFQDVVTLVPPHNRDELVKSISSMLLNPSVVDSVNLRKKYDAKNVFERYSEIYPVNDNE